MDRAILGRYLFFASLLVYAASFALPAFNVLGPLYGFQAFYVTGLSVAFDVPRGPLSWDSMIWVGLWAANCLFLAALLCLLYGRRCTAALAGAAAVVSGSGLLFDNNTMVGYRVWLLSMALLSVAALVTPAKVQLPRQPA